MHALHFLVAFLVLCYVAAQDPGPEWLGYAKGVYPGGGIITYAEVQWQVPQNSKEQVERIAYWWGIETSDNLNLIQPVLADNQLSNAWAVFGEYFQWSPEENPWGSLIKLQPGDHIYSNITYNKANDDYLISITANSKTVTLKIPVQKKNKVDKEYTILYFVVEHGGADCADYSPSNKIVFYDIYVEYNGKAATPKWTTGFVKDCCSNRAHVLNSTTVEITWNYQNTSSACTDLKKF